MYKVMLAIIVFVVALVFVSVTSYAQYCGGSIQQVSDLSSNRRAYAVACCPDGYRVQGIACSDLPEEQDMGDGCTTVCRSIKDGNRQEFSGDIQRNPAVYECDKTEVMAGIACKDTDKHGGGVNSDVADGCTVFCQNPKSKAVRRIRSDDIDGNRNAGYDVTVLLPRRVVGIACKDKDSGTSDRLDGCTIITK